MCDFTFNVESELHIEGNFTFNSQKYKTSEELHSQVVATSLGWWKFKQLFLKKTYPFAPGISKVGKAPSLIVVLVLVLLISFSWK